MQKVKNKDITVKANGQRGVHKYGHFLDGEVGIFQRGEPSSDNTMYLKMNSLFASLDREYV